MVSEEFITEDVGQTQKLAERIAGELKNFSATRRDVRILALYGDLGSGKTTFVQGLARGLGIKKRILSPSFTLIRQYKVSRVGHLGGDETMASTPARCKTFYHIDLYRLEKLGEIEGLGLEEIFTDKKAIAAIEWAEKIKEILPEKRWDIYFKYTGNDKRKIIITFPSRTVLDQGQSLLRSEEAIEILKKGGLVVFPTDTAFGVGCRMDNEEAVERLLKLKRRPEDQAVPVLVDTIEMAQKYLLPISKGVLNLMEKYWPGGLTIVYPCRVDLVSESVRGGGQNLGVRWPDHLAAKNLIRGVGVPILGPSANFHGEATPYKLSDLNPKFLKNVDYVLKGEPTRKIASTVIDCSQKPWKIIRQGAIRIENYE